MSDQETQLFWNNILSNCVTKKKKKSKINVAMFVWKSGKRSCIGYRNLSKAFLWTGYSLLN